MEARHASFCTPSATTSPTLHTRHLFCGPWLNLSYMGRNPGTPCFSFGIVSRPHLRSGPKTCSGSNPSSTVSSSIAAWGPTCSWLLPPETFNHENYIVRAKIPCAALTSWSLLGSQRSTGVFCTCQIWPLPYPAGKDPSQTSFPISQTSSIPSYLQPNWFLFPTVHWNYQTSQSRPPWEPGVT